MDRKISMAIISVGLFASFFLPFFTWQSFELSGLNFVLSSHTPPYKYFLLVIPFLTLVFICGITFNENFSFIRKLLSWIPLIVLGIVFIGICINQRIGESVFEQGNIYSNTGLGFWIALSLSLLLAFKKVNPGNQY